MTPKRSSGFTLLELLVSLTLCGLLASMAGHLLSTTYHRLLLMRHSPHTSLESANILELWSADCRYLARTESEHRNERIHTLLTAYNERYRSKNIHCTITPLTYQLQDAVPRTDPRLYVFTVYTEHKALSCVFPR